MPELPPIPVWRSTIGTWRSRLAASAVVLVFLVIAVEALRVSFAGLASGLTPNLFGVLPTRNLQGFDAWLLILVAGSAALLFLSRIVWIMVRGLPRQIDLADTPQGPALAVEFDGLIPHRALFPVSRLHDLAAVRRRLLAGIGIQVRARLEGARRHLVLAQLQGDAAAEELVTRLQRLVRASQDPEMDIRQVAQADCGCSVDEA